MQHSKKCFLTVKLPKNFNAADQRLLLFYKKYVIWQQEDLVRHIKRNAFTIATDGSNDLGSTKQFPLVVRTVIGGKANSFVLTVPIIEWSAIGKTKNILLF